MTRMVRTSVRRLQPILLIVGALFALFATSPLLFSRGFAPYSSITRYVDRQLWFAEGKRTFDSNGILLQDGSYNPLAVCLIGIMRYEDFLETKDSLFYSQAVAQYRYFQQPDLTTSRFGGAGLGLPYQINFKDLETPWYSGMAQGVALSYLLRYFDLTGDSSALRVARRVAFFMLVPEALGGTTARRANGDWWIQEYPRSAKSPFVMNGFINALIGLREYLAFFPNDRVAQGMHRACYRSLIRSFRDYDLPNSTSYNALRYSLVPPCYLHYQIHEMEHLHAIYRDPIFHYQQMLWAGMSVGIKDDTHFLVENYAPPMVPLLQVARGQGYILGWPLSKACTPLRGWELEDYIGDGAGQLGVWRLVLPSATSSRVLSLPSGVEICSTKDCAKLVDCQLGQQGVFCLDDSTKEVLLQANMSNIRKDSIWVGKLDRQSGALPRFGFASLGTKQVETDERWSIRLIEGHQPQGAIFFRWASDLPQLKKTVWRQEYRIPIRDTDFQVDFTGVVEAKMVLDFTIPCTWVTSLEVSRIQ